MPRYIIVSFLIMGWAFYELSGGADFEPRRAAGIAPEAPQKTLRVADTRPANPTPAAHRVEAVALVAAPAITPLQAKLADATDKGAAIRPGFEKAGLSEPDPTSQITLASLEQSGIALGTPVIGGNPERSVKPLTAAAAESDAETQPQKMDLRVVTASRVNMRNGPGTRYSVLTRLNRGDKIEVLADPGEGWLKLRQVPDGQVGWIAARLVSAADE